MLSTICLPLRKPFWTPWTRSLATMERVQPMLALTSLLSALESESGLVSSAPRVMVSPSCEFPLGKNAAALSVKLGGKD
eukprot:6637523-Pyramimonas_sp.AAC.1